MAKIDPDAKLQTMLEAVIEEYAQNAGTDFPSAFRDALTDLKYIADEKGIDFDETVIVALHTLTHLWRALVRSRPRKRRNTSPRRSRTP